MRKRRFLVGVDPGDQNDSPQRRKEEPFDPTQASLFDTRFDGDDYNHERDSARLTGQIKRVYDFMLDGAWKTLDEISDATGDPHSSVSAQLRNLRKKRFGGHNIERKYMGGGLYSYRLEQGPPPLQSTTTDKEIDSV